MPRWAFLHKTAVKHTKQPHCLFIRLQDSGTNVCERLKPRVPLIHTNIDEVPLLMETNNLKCMLRRCYWGTFVLFYRPTLNRLSIYSYFIWTYELGHLSISSNMWCGMTLIICAGRCHESTLGEENWTHKNNKSIFMPRVNHLICSLMKWETTVSVPPTQDECRVHQCGHSQLYSH